MPSPAPRAVLLDLLMATMNSVAVWETAAGDRDEGLAWRDAVTLRMIEAGNYRPYGQLVAEAAEDLGIDDSAPGRLVESWRRMDPWPDATSLAALTAPFAFLTNCSRELGHLAARRSGADPAFTLTAEEIGWFKPRPEAYRIACARIGTRPARTAFVAGALYDAIGARAAGMQVWLLARRPIPERLPPGITVAGTIDEAIDEALAGRMP